MFKKAEGTVEKAAGDLQEVFGNVTGDASNQIDGKVHQGLGVAKETYGEALNSAKDTYEATSNRVREIASDRPVLFLASAVAAGFVLGAIWAKR